MPIFRWAYPIYILYFTTSFLHYTLTKNEKKKKRSKGGGMAKTVLSLDFYV